MTESKIREVKQLLVNGCTHRKIARLFGVGKTTIGDVASGKTWRHVSPVN